MDKKELEQRTLDFAVRVVRLVSKLPRGMAGEVLGRQFLKSGTSIGANYREANRGESTEDFIHKLAIVEKEASESCYWLEIMEHVSLGEATERAWLRKESGELLAIFTSSEDPEIQKPASLSGGQLKQWQSQILN
jgi:four helix bundle protein